MLRTLPARTAVRAFRQTTRCNVQYLSTKPAAAGISMTRKGPTAVNSQRTVATASAPATSSPLVFSPACDSLNTHHCTDKQEKVQVQHSTQAQKRMRIPYNRVTMADTRIWMSRRSNTVVAANAIELIVGIASLAKLVERFSMR